MATKTITTCDICNSDIPVGTGAEIIQHRTLPNASMLASDYMRSINICDECLTQIPLPEWKKKDPINWGNYTNAAAS